jgi:Fe-S cluster assembly ATP-binding protein
MLSIQNLEARIDNKNILNGLNLNINPGEVHAIWAPMVQEKYLSKCIIR